MEALHEIHPQMLLYFTLDALLRQPLAELTFEIQFGELRQVFQLQFQLCCLVKGIRAGGDRDSSSSASRC